MGRSEKLNEAIKQVLSGDREAFRSIVAENRLMLRSFLGCQLHHASDVDDIAQDVFIAAFRKLDQFDLNGDFPAWLRGIARLQLLHHFRTQGRANQVASKFREEVLHVLEQDLEQTVASQTSVAIEALLRCIEKLPQKMRHIVRAGLNGTKSVALAEELSMSIGAIYTMHYRANRLLRDCVKSELQ